MTNGEAINLLDNLIGMIEDNQNSDYDKALKMAIEALKQPEGKTGRWLPDNNFLYETRFVCSNCKESECVPTIGFTEYRPIWDFCPNCGADMRGDNNEIN